MQEAKRTIGHHKLEQYLSTLVPDMRRRIWDDLFADVTFPKLQNTVEFRPARPDGWCVVYDTVAPEGLVFVKLSTISQYNTTPGVDTEAKLYDEHVTTEQLCWLRSPSAELGDAVKTDVISTRSHCVSRVCSFAQK